MRNERAGPGTRRPPRLLSGLCLALALSGCSGGYTVTSTHTVGTLEGRLEAGVVEWDDMVIDCIWLVDRSGHKAEIMGFPDGWAQRTAPLEILDPAGRMIAREGTLLRITFNADAIGETMCAPGTPLIAHTVETIESLSPRPPAVTAEPTPGP